VLRFLGGPLRELRRLTPSATLLPRAATPPIATESAADNGADPAIQATQARQRGEALLREGNPEEGIRTLRRAVSLAPRALATRLSLVKAYLTVSRPDRAEDEARRALLVGDPDDAASRAELIRLLGATLLSAGDPDGARENFEKALAGDPNNLDLRLALAKLQLEKGDVAGAEGHFQTVLKGHPDDREAALGMAKILCSRGDFDGAQKALAAAPSIDARQRHDFVTGVFLETAMRIAARTAQNRTALEEGALDKATFKTALVAQLKRMGPLEKMLQASPPPASAAEVVARSHKHRLLAASLLIQALTTMQTFLDTGENASGAQSRVFLGEFFAEIKEAASPDEG
jgi:Tfp pilus assembly protein PilF